MKIKTIALKDKDVSELNEEQLTSLKKFEKDPVFSILMHLATKAKTRRAFEALEADDIEQISLKKGINIGTDFIMDSVNRAKEELKRRSGEDIDSEE